MVKVTRQDANVELANGPYAHRKTSFQTVVKPCSFMPRLLASLNSRDR